MTDKLKALMADIDRDHALFDALINQPAGQLNAYPPCAESGTDNASPCRTHIRETLSKYLIFSLRHFDQEYQAMHEIGFPRDLFEAHAIEHDNLLTQVNQAIGTMNNGASTAALINAIDEINKAYCDHRDKIDSTLIDFLHNLYPDEAITLRR